MRSRSRLPRVLAGCATALLVGCSTGSGPDRDPGDAVTVEEAEALGGLLHRNLSLGGADFVVTAPYGGDAVVTLTGEVDFADQAGRAQAVTSFGDDREDDVRTLFFTPERVWFGDVPGLADALAAAGTPEAVYLARPVAEEGDVPLVDLLVQVLLNLSASSDDPPQAFLDGGYTWQGQRSIDSRLSSVFGLPGGRSVAVGATDELLLQYRTPLPGGEIEMTVTLSDHGPRELTVPAEEATAAVADHPELAAQLGV